MSTSDFNTGEFNWKFYASNIQANLNQNLQFDVSGNSSMIFRTSTAQRLRITDASSIFLNSVDLSANSLVNVNNIIPSRANPQIDASFNFSVVSVSKNTTGRGNLIPNPYFGQLNFLTGPNILQMYNNGGWIDLIGSYGITVDGNLAPYTTITFLNSVGTQVQSPTSGGFTVYKFQDTSTLAPGKTISGWISINFTGPIDYLIVGGGGGGGQGTNGGGSGGGGAGGYIYLTNQTITRGDYTIQVGAGGTGGQALGINQGPGTLGSNGTSSTFSLQATPAIGGGRGRNQDGNAGDSGGSGGGGAGGASPAPGAGGASTQAAPGVGFAGGAGVNATPIYGGGGGGGAGGGGGLGTGNVSGNGGPGLSNTITGTSTFYAGGGGGSGSGYIGTISAITNTGGSGGSGGGGNGGVGYGYYAAIPTLAINGTNGLGGGGGGGYCTNAFSAGTIGTSPGSGGNGGSGVVIIRFASFV